MSGLSDALTSSHHQPAPAHRTTRSSGIKPITLISVILLLLHSASPPTLRKRDRIRADDWAKIKANSRYNTADMFIRGLPLTFIVMCRFEFTNHANLTPLRVAGASATEVARFVSFLTFILSFFNSIF